MNKISFRLSPFLRSNLWSILLLLAIAVYLYILSSLMFWTEVGIPQLTAPFADMQAILSASDAYREGLNPYIENPLDPLGRKHVYPRVWLWLGHTGITLGHSNIAAILMATFFFLLCIGILRPDNGREFLISAILLLSPAVMLGVERGNNDLIIFILLVLAVFFLNHKIRALDYVAYFFLLLASMLKLYPIASFLVFVRIIKNNKKFWIFTLFSLSFFAAYTLLSLSDFQYLKDVIPKPHGRFTFGAAIFFEWFFDKWPVNRTHLYLMIIAAIGLAFLISTRVALADTREDSNNTIFFLIGSLNLLFCFFTNTNYDYRCIFFILILPWIIEQLKCTTRPSPTRRCVKILLFLLPVIVWNEAIINLIGTKLGAPGISQAKLNVIVFFYILEHSITWMVMTIILAFCIELMKRPLRDKMMAPFRNILR